MPVEISEVFAEVDISPPPSALGAGAAGASAAEDLAERLEALQRRSVQGAERVAAWGRDD